MASGDLDIAPELIIASGDFDMEPEDMESELIESGELIIALGELLGLLFELELHAATETTIAVPAMPNAAAFTTVFISGSYQLARITLTPPIRNGLRHGLVGFEKTC